MSRHVSRCSRSAVASLAGRTVRAGCPRRAPAQSDLYGKVTSTCMAGEAQNLHRQCLRRLSSATDFAPLPDNRGGGDGRGGGPLAGLTVLDCGNFLAGPIVSLHLSAMGADVIKVEKPRNGDDSRAVGPFAPDGSSSYHLSTNRGKRSVALDTRTEAGRKVFLDLAARADIL